MLVHRMVKKVKDSKVLAKIKMKDEDSVIVSPETGGYDISVFINNKKVKTAWKSNKTLALQTARDLADFYRDDNGQSLNIVTKDSKTKDKIFYPEAIIKVRGQKKKVSKPVVAESQEEAKEKLKAFIVQEDSTAEILEMTCDFKVKDSIKSRFNFKKTKDVIPSDEEIGKLVSEVLSQKKDPTTAIAEIQRLISSRYHLSMEERERLVPTINMAVRVYTRNVKDKKTKDEVFSGKDQYKIKIYKVGAGYNWEVFDPQGRKSISGLQAVSTESAKKDADRKLGMQIFSTLDSKTKDDALDDKSFDIRNIEKETIENNNFRKVLFTGNNLQLVLMSLLPNEDIGMEVHPNVDQFFRIDEGNGQLDIKGEGKSAIENGTSIVVKAGTYHNIIAGNKGLKLYTVYAPPNHPPDRVQKTKAEAMAAEAKAAEAKG